MGSKRRDKNSDVEVAKSKMADLVFICLIEQDVTWVDINGKNRIPGRNSRWKGGERLWEVNESGRIAEQSTYEVSANIAEPGVDEGNIAASQEALTLR
jgi:hypothetical protein